MLNIAILQPRVPNYREEFFEGINQKYDIELYAYLDEKTLKKNAVKEASIKVKKIAYFSFLKRIQVYNFFPLLNSKYQIIILSAEIRSISTWLLLFILKFTNRQVVLWGHGISIPRYLDEEKRLPKIKIIFHKLADQVWLYTDKEKELWSMYIDANKLISLNNTINTEQILDMPKLEKYVLKEKYNIKTEIVLIFCAKFSTPYRRTDLMIEIFRSLDSNKYSLIVIGDGQYKPDFSLFKNVYDFGAVYNNNIKNELFTISDLYFQPAWTGLSIVEAMAYGKPIVTLTRSTEIYQCVEYTYIKHLINGYIGKNKGDIIEFLKNITPSEIRTLQKSTIEFIQLNLKMDDMIHNALYSLEKINHPIKNS